MDSGTIIYLILGAALLLFNLFNSSNKRKKQREQQEAARQRTESQPSYSEAESDEDWWLKPSTQSIPKGIPSTPYVRKEFQSSLGSAASYGEESSAFAQGSSRGIEKRGGRKIRRAATVHPLLKDLLNDSGTDELRKGLIYSEIFQRKY